MLNSETTNLLLNRHMVFSATIFLLYFLPLFLLIYFLSPEKLRNYVLLTFSIVFYAWGAPKFILS